MKVSITVTVAVDPETWDLLYGTGTKAADVREDVRQYIGNGIARLSGDGAINDVTWR